MKLTPRAMSVWNVAGLIVSLQFFLQMSVGVISYDLSRDFALTAFSLSLISSSYYYIYVLFQTPVGILADYYGPRKLLSIGTAFCCLGCYLFAAANNIYLAILGRILMGGGLSFGFVCSIKLASVWFDRKYLSLLIGLAETYGMAGSIIGSVSLAVWVEHVGWRQCYHIFAVVALGLAMLAWLVVRDGPTPKAHKKISFKILMRNLRIILKTKLIWLCGMYIGIMYVIVIVFCALWGIQFLQLAHKLSLYQATIACSAVLAGMGISSPFTGRIFCCTGAREIYMLNAGIIITVLFCIILYVNCLPYWMILMILLLMGILSSSMLLGYTIGDEAVKKSAKSTAVGFVNTLALSAGIFLQPLVGYILDLLSDQIDASNVEIYTVGQFRIAMSVLPILMLVALYLCWLIVKFTRPQLKITSK